MDNEWWIIILAIFGIFALWLMVTTIIGAIILYIIVLVFNVGTFSWWYAFLVGILLSLAGTFFTSSGRRLSSGKEVRVIEKHYYNRKNDYEEE
jgi:MFS family permease